MSDETSSCGLADCGSTVGACVRASWKYAEETGEYEADRGPPSSPPPVSPGNLLEDVSNPSQGAQLALLGEYSSRSVGLSRRKVWEKGDSEGSEPLAKNERLILK